MDKLLLDRIMSQVTKPVRYMGNEYNMVEKTQMKFSSDLHLPSRMYMR